MKKQTIPVLIAILLMLAPVFAADDGKTKTVEKDVIFNVAVPPPAMLGSGAVMFDQMIDIKVVTGAPYSAVANSESVQTLADGNRIVHRNSTQVARDSQGRTRHEYSFEAPAEGGKPVTMISINDPTIQTTYTLHPDAKTAEKISLPDMPPAPESSEDVTIGVEAGVQSAGAPKASTHVFIRKGGPGPDTVMATGASSAHMARFKITTGPIEDNTNTEQLGKQVIEGIETEGKRTTTTIPAGEIGNEQPIVITNEVWYSPELQTIVYSKRDDPMAGTTIFKLTNIVREEPDAALFQVPPDYKVLNAEMKMRYFQNKVAKPDKK